MTQTQGARTISVTAGSFALTGVAAALSHNRKFGAAPGSFSLSGIPLPLPAFPLSISANGRYLKDANNQPFFAHGYVAWYAGFQLSQANQTIFLDAMAAKKINALIVQLHDYDDTGGGVAPLPDIDGNLPFTGTVSGQLDFTTPNSAFWARVDWFLEACRVRGICVWLFPAYYGYILGGSTEGWGNNGVLALNGSTRLTTYGAFLGTRYAAQSNIIWCHYGDALPDATGRALVKAIRDGIKSTDRAGRLHTNHYSRPSLSTDDTTVTADVNWAYANGAGTGTRVHQEVLTGYAVSGPKPVFLGEDYYDHRSSAPQPTAQQQRANTWETWLSGGCAKFFGDEYVWSFDVWNGQHWSDHLNDTSISQYIHARTLLAPRSWYLLTPSVGTGLVTSGGGTVNTDGYKPRTLSSDGKLGLVYVTDGTSVTVNMALMSGTITARWYDPSAGTFSAVTGGPTFANSGTHAFIASTEVGNNANSGTDWVLVLESP